MTTPAFMRTIDDFAHDETWDSRDAIERIDYLASQLQGDDDESPPDNTAGRLDPEEYSELLAWREFLTEVVGYCADWKYGEQFIADDYFTTYAQELAEDIGAIGHDLPWPATHIDWDAAADALKMDYGSAELAGHTFWYR